MADAISAVERRNGGARILAVCWNSVSEPRLEKSGRFADSVILLRWPSSIAMQSESACSAFKSAIQIISSTNQGQMREGLREIA
jgi:hypothetical protein